MFASTCIFQGNAFPQFCAGCHPISQKITLQSICGNDMNIQNIPDFVKSMTLHYLCQIICILIILEITGNSTSTFYLEVF